MKKLKKTLKNTLNKKVSRPGLANAVHTIVNAHFRSAVISVKHRGLYPQEPDFKTGARGYRVIMADQSERGRDRTGVWKLTAVRSDES